MYCIRILLLISGGQDVHRSIHSFCSMLASIPFVFHLCIFKQTNSKMAMDETYLSSILFHGNVKRSGESHDLFCNECKVCIIIVFYVFFQKYLFCNLWDRKYRQIMWRRQGSEKQQDTFLVKAMFCGKIMFFTIFRYWNQSSSSCEKSKLIGNNSWKCGFWMKSQGNAKYEKRFYLARESHPIDCKKN